MKVRFDRIGYPPYCDAGPYEGDMRIDLSIRLYLSPEEYARYEGSESLQITLNESGGGRLRTGNAAEPSGELSVGDVAAVGEVPLAVGRVGWKPVHGSLAEVRVHEHGTRPLPAPGPARATPGEPPIDSPRKEPNRP